MRCPECGFDNSTGIRFCGQCGAQLAQEQQGSALAYVEDILDYQETHPKLEGTQEPLRIYLTCYRVLRANGDPRTRQILDSAYRLLQERARTIEDEYRRHSYHENVAAHRDVVREFAQSS